MAQLVLREPQVTSEKEVVANERRYRVDDDVEGAVSELLYKTAFTTHAYRWPTIGWMADIEGFTTDDCAAFYRTYYAPNNATVVVVGDFDEKDVLARIQEHYGELERARDPGRGHSPGAAAARASDAWSIEEADRHRQAARSATTGRRFGDADHVPLTMLNEVLFCGRSSRCHRALIQEEEICTELRGWVGTFRDPGLFEIYVTARPGSTRRGAPGVARPPARPRVVERARHRGRARQGEGAGRARARAEPGDGERQGRADRLLRTVLGDPVGAFARLEAYRRTTRSDLLRVARRYLVKGRLAPSSRCTPRGVEHRADEPLALGPRAMNARALHSSKENHALPL